MNLDNKHSRWGEKNYNKKWLNQQPNISGRCKTFHHKICSSKNCKCSCHTTVYQRSENKK